jgi:hypothetical protein
MKSALQLLVTAPDNEVRRMQLIFQSIADGDWNEAWFNLSNITITENSSPARIKWVEEAQELCDFCSLAKQATRKSL